MKITEKELDKLMWIEINKDLSIHLTSWAPGDSFKSLKDLATLLARYAYSVGVMNQKAHTKKALKELTGEDWDDPECGDYL